MRLNTPLKISALALLLVGGLLALYAGLFGLPWPSRFELAWDEEVQLHDARIIHVHIKRSYESRQWLSRRDGIRRATDISFDAGPPFGLFSARFQPEDIALIDQKDDVWYFVLVRPAGTKHAGQAPFLKLAPGGQLQEAGREETLPAEFTHWNVMPDTPNPELVAAFNHTQLRLADKLRHWAAYPRDGNDVMRLRPKT